MKPEPMERFAMTVNGIDLQFEPRGPYYRMRWRDPRSHKENNKSTKQGTKAGAKGFATQFFDKYIPGRTPTGTVTVADLVEAMLAHKRNHQPRDYEEKKRNWELRLRDKFGSWNHDDLTEEVIEDYKAWCLGLPVDQHTSHLRRGWKPIAETTTMRDGEAVRLRVIEKGTINLDLAVLSKAYRMGLRARKISQQLWVAKYGRDELNVRTGEVSIEAFDRVMAQPLPVWLRGILQTSWDGGARIGEPKALRVHQFDGQGFQIAPGRDRQRGATEKNGQGRWVPLSAAGVAVVKQCVAGKKPTDYVFTRSDRGQPPRPVGDFRKLWAEVLGKAGITRHVIPHDFRRTAVSNLRDAGVDEKLCMEIVGHKTPEMNRRYRQGGRHRLIAAMRQKEAWEQGQRQETAAPHAAPHPADQLAELQKKLAAAEAREAQTLAALQALQQAIGALQIAPAASTLRPLSGSPVVAQA